MTDAWPPVTDVEIDPDNPGEVAISIDGKYALGIPLHQARQIRDGLNRLDLEGSKLCPCAECMPEFWGFRVCALCGNKRCPHAANHENACMRSNEPGQPGSLYPAAPTRENARPEGGAMITHVIWSPLFDTPIDIRLSREQLQCVQDALLGRTEPAPGWNAHFASEIEKILVATLDEASPGASKEAQ